MQKSYKFLLEIMMLVSSANIMGIAKVFIVGGRSFIQIMKSKGHKINTCGTPCSSRYFGVQRAILFQSFDFFL
jgi:hypothetical protein